VASVIAGLAVVVLVAVGLLGLVLPILPGVLFLGLAAIVAAKYFPTIASRLRRHRAARAHLDVFERARTLELRSQLSLAGWYGAKIGIDGAAALARAARRLWMLLR
jgi:uncharacterized membrane protein YbaN (DUF454 family)